jgi:hypothetical protein
MPFAYFSARSYIFPALWLTLGASIACSSGEVTPASPASSTPNADAGGGGTTDDDTSKEGTDAGSTSGQPKSDSGAPSSAATIEIANATFTNVKGMGGKFYYTVTIELENTSAADVTALDTLTYDFGGGKKVSRTKAACAGKFTLAAGDSAQIETQIGVDPDTGMLEDYGDFCSPTGTQYFGGSTGSAPATSTFEGPIAITIGGKTSKGTFTGSGSATRM